MAYRLEALNPAHESEWPEALAALLHEHLADGWILLTSVTRDLPPAQQLGGMSGPLTPKPHTVLVFWHD